AAPIPAIGELALADAAVAVRVPGGEGGAAIGGPFIDADAAVAVAIDKAVTAACRVGAARVEGVGDGFDVLADSADGIAAGEQCDRNQKACCGFTHEASPSYSSALAPPPHKRAQRRT